MTNDKLTDDPIAEALLEYRFESADLAEIVIGRLSDIDVWRAGVKTRLPTADIPVPMREANGPLRHVPSLEIKGATGISAVRIGANVLSVHFLHPYAGWDEVFPLLLSTTVGLFKVLPSATVTRLGLRYINVFTEDRHHVNSVRNLALRIAVADRELDAPITMALFEQTSPRHGVTTRIASRMFMQGNVPPGATAAVDVDVGTPDGFADRSPDSINAWVDEAHTFEKAAFRKLLPDALYEALRDKADARTH